MRELFKFSTFWMACNCDIVDIVAHLNYLDLQLQGKTHLVNEMYNHIVTFDKNKL